MNKRRHGAVCILCSLSLFLLLLSCGKAEQGAQNVSAGPEAAMGGLEIDMGRGDAEMEVTCEIASGDTLFSVLLAQGLSREDAQAAVSEFTKVSDPRKIKAGQRLTVRFQQETVPIFAGFTLTVDPMKDLIVSRTAEGGFQAFEQHREAVVSHHRVDGMIDSTLYSAALDSGLPLNTLFDFIYLYSFDIDFQREVQPGDTFSVLYEQYCDNSGRPFREGDILYASITVGGKEREIFRFEGSNGEADYFDSTGKSARKTLLKTPINGAYISSGYGMRISPILGYSRFHPAIDYAAKEGTPIYAAGDGTIVEIGYNDVYGNHVRIVHANGYGTLYGHMIAYGQGVRRGAKVKQGSVIGYVGSTGMTTGPHLHYEVTYQGKQINPALLKFPPGKVLKGEELVQFEAARLLLKREFDRCPIPPEMYRILHNIPQ